MSKRISYKEARKKREHELNSQELNKQGIRPKVSRHEKKKRMKMKKTERFVDLLRFRGGYKPDSIDEKIGKDA